MLEVILKTVPLSGKLTMTLVAIGVTIVIIDKKVIIELCFNSIVYVPIQCAAYTAFYIFISYDVEQEFIVLLFFFCYLLNKHILISSVSKHIKVISVANRKGGVLLNRILENIARAVLRAEVLAIVFKEIFSLIFIIPDGI